MATAKKDSKPKAGTTVKKNQPVKETPASPELPKPENKLKAVDKTPEPSVTQKTTISIKKGKIKDDLFLEVSYDQTIDGEQQDSFTRDCTHAIHQDLRNAFAKLRIHFILLCQQIPLKDSIRIVDTATAEIPMMEEVIVRQFSLSGTGQKEGLILSGSRKLKDGSVLHMNSPFRRLCDDNSSYKHLDALNDVLGECSKEIERYLFEEKYGEAKQSSIQFPEGSDVDDLDDDND
ncbi:MAG: hypothetical protein H7Y01_13300 [Ferruginibacter sp.]|nr:hypothetical protein [Chitinophagaceae bacterium]